MPDSVKLGTRFRPGEPWTVGGRFNRKSQGGMIRSISSDHDLQHAATARRVSVSDEARVDVRVGREEAVDNRAHLTIVVPLPMSESVQGALLTGERFEAEDARRSPARARHGNPSHHM